MKKYKDIGFKLTPQRLAILEFLDGNKSHPSAEEIYRTVSVKFPTMSFATVYNTLETMRKRGKLLELTIDPDKKRFDPNPNPHHHLICIRCKRIVDIDENFILDIPSSKTEQYEIIGNHIEFYGLCPNCKENDERG